MRETIKRFHLPTLIITALLVAVTAVASGFAWWLNERITTLEGGVPMMPRSEVTKAERQTRRTAEIINYSFQTRRTAKQVESFYQTSLENDGWFVVEAAENVLQFERDESSVRLVLHQQRFKTLFTLNVRNPVVEK